MDETVQLKFVENQADSEEVQQNKALMNEVNKVMKRFDKSIKALASKHNVQLKTMVTLEVIAE